MAFIIDWDNDDRTVILSQADEAWTWDEFFAQLIDAYTLIETVDHPVNVVVTGLENLYVPPSAMIRELRALRRQRPWNMGFIVLVGANPYLRAISHVMGRIFPHSSNTMLRYATSLDLARIEARIQYRGMG